MANRFAQTDAVKDERVEDDFIGGGGVLPTDIYTATIKAAYETGSARSKAVAMNLILMVDGKEVRQQIWMTNGKGGVTYKDKRSGETKNLPGYNQVNALFMLVLGKEIGEADVEEQVMKLYDFDAKAEINKTVDCYTELHGQEIQIALQQQTVDKTKKNDQTDEYEPTGETRDINEVVKFFPASRQVTISEVTRFIKTLNATLDDVLESGEMEEVLENMPSEPGEFAAKWLEKNQGEVYNKAKGKGKSEGKSFGGGKKASDDGDAGAKKKSLFGK